MTPAQYKALMMRRQQMIQRNNDLSNNDLSNNDLTNKRDGNLLLNKNVTFEDENNNKPPTIQPNSAPKQADPEPTKVLPKAVPEVPKAVPEPPKPPLDSLNVQQTKSTIKQEETNNNDENVIANKKVISNYEFLMKQQKEMISTLNLKNERLEKQVETLLSRHEIKNAKNEAMIVTLNTTINNLSEIIRNNFSKEKPPSLDVELQTEKEEIKKSKEEEKIMQQEAPKEEQPKEEAPKDEQSNEEPPKEEAPKEEPPKQEDDTQINVKLETNNENITVKLEVEE